MLSDSGTVDFDEFLPLMAAQIKEREELSFYKNLFRMLDKKNKGFITCADLRYILQVLPGEGVHRGAPILSQNFI